MSAAKAPNEKTDCAPTVLVSETKAPPHDLDAEGAVLSAVLLDADNAFSKIGGIVDARHFYADANRRIYEAAAYLHEQGTAIDVTTVGSRLRDTERLPQIGGTQYLSDILDKTPAVAHVDDHARIIREKWRQRCAAEIALDLAADVKESKDPAATHELLRRAQESLAELDVDVRPAAPDLFTTLGSLIVPALDRAARRRSGDETPVPVPFRELSEAYGGGLWSGAHVLVSGTGTGKSQLQIQTGLGAAKVGVPVCYIGLELDEAQIALRALGEHIGIRWSSLYLGRCSEADLARAREAAPTLEGLPFYCDFGSAHGWPASRLAALAEGMRKRHPSGPMLIVLDYLQLVGDDTGDFQRSQDLRERIGSAAYAARDVARRYDASVSLISSAARNHYGLLAGDFQAAGLATKPGNFGGSEKVITHPHALMGLGKESGEIEFSADTSTVLLRWPARLDDGSSAIIAAVPKVRAGVERWCALRFAGGRFDALPIASTDELPEPPARPKRGNLPEPVSTTELDKRVLETVRNQPALRSATAIATATKGTKGELLKRIKTLVETGAIQFVDGFAVVSPNREGAPNQ